MCVCVCVCVRVCVCVGVFHEDKNFSTHDLSDKVTSNDAKIKKKINTITQLYLLNSPL